MFTTAAAPDEGRQSSFEFFKHKGFGQKIIRAFMQGADSFGQ
ncbi:hypothetical protein D555_1394 [Bordetella holmesii 35009]|nr:hypothetical protein D555_1394 [Bordetella holmesii 35009]